MTTAEELITDNLDIWASAIQAKSSAGRGNGKSTELYGLKKLRELILDLAISGLLNPESIRTKDQSHNDLEQAKSIKKEMIREGKAKPTRGAHKDEGAAATLSFPDYWKSCLIEEIAWPQAGFAFKSKDFNDVESGLPLIRIRDVGFAFSGTYFSGEYREEFVVNNGDTLISMDGEFRVRPWANGEALLNQRVTRLHIPSPTSTKFVRIALQKALSSLQGKKSYTTVDHLSTKQIASCTIPFPSFDEQEEIVAKVNELMALCDQLEQQTEASIAAHQTLVETLLGALTNAPDHASFQQAWQRIAEHFDTLFNTEHSIDQLKQTILQLAVMGKLVPQDPNDEPASELLKRIAAERTQLINEEKIKKQKPVQPIDENHEPFPLPKGWCFTHLQELYALITDGDHQAPPKSKSGIPFLVIGNLNTGHINFSNCKFVPEEYYKGLDWGKKPTKNDHLYTVTGSFGIPVLVGTSEEFCVQRHVAIFKSTESTPSAYLSLALNSKIAYEYSSSVATGIAQKTVPLSGLRKMPIPLPPEREQKAINSRVTALLAICDQLKSCLTQSQNTQILLADALTEQVIA